MYFEQILLHCQSKIGNERTTSALFHLLTGKKSIQTIHDAKLFGLEQYFAIYKSLHPNVYQTYVDKLISDGYLETNDVQVTYTTITNRGHAFLQQQPIEIFRYLNGKKYEKKVEVFYKRFLLLIQTFTNTKKGNFNFISIIDDQQTMYWIKEFYHQNKGQEENVLMSIYEELVSLLAQIENEAASIFVDQITSYKSYGLSTHQLSQKYKRSIEDIYLIHIGVIHYILAQVENGSYPALTNIATIHAQTPYNLTLSASKTFELMKQGFEVAEIAQIRKLKLNTIEDHIVEIALLDQNFSITPFVNRNHQEEIMNAIKQSNSLRLKKIKSLVHESIRYFEIRLVLTKVSSKGGE
ncbi:helix-turn-helix domain-containing protein [Virgibacillus soli]|uniref:helix-turn-helix domain-containing protein n=1 Tax=Paracerasibacillus soli TaxID=480284 RepID=UPI0035E9C89B